MDQETHEMGKNVKHTDYIYDLGEYPVKHGNLQRFRVTPIHGRLHNVMTGPGHARDRVCIV